MDSNNILYKHQYGFRKGHSTNRAIITLVERVAKALDTGKIVVGFFGHPGSLRCNRTFYFIKKVLLFRNQWQFYTWIKSYLTNRYQFVVYNNSKSETKFITHGVPQGSIIGPFFFIVFMNNFSRASELLFSIFLADDTTVIIEGQNTIILYLLLILN